MLSSGRVCVDQLVGVSGTVLSRSNDFQCNTVGWCVMFVVLMCCVVVTKCN